jgi:hypothetical protein
VKIAKNGSKIDSLKLAQKMIKNRPNLMLKFNAKIGSKNDIKI